MIKYRRILGEGSFSKVYEAYDEKGRQYAIKIENRGGTELLENEYKIQSFLLKRDEENKYIVPIYDFFSDENKNYMVMKRLHMSLGDVIKKIDISFDDYSIRNVAKKILETLKFIHSNNICHCDIKPENIMISDDLKNIYLVDYGLAKYYKKNGKHIFFKTDINPAGTLRYMSVHSNHNVEISRRDDIISLGYVLVFLQRKSLPWQNIQKDRFKKIGEMKLDINFEELCKNCVPELIQYFEYCYGLGFLDEPNYDYLIKLFDLKVED